MDKNLNVVQLCELRSKMILEGKNVDKLNHLIRLKEQEYIEYLKEDTSGTGGPSGASLGGAVGAGGVAFATGAIAGMGGVVSSQPAASAGVTTDPGYTAAGGTVGSGDVSVPYNTGGKKVFQKIKVDNRKGTNKRRNNKMMAGLIQGLKNRQDFMAGQDSSGVDKPKKGRVMNFSDFNKDDLMKVTKISEIPK